MVSRYSSSAIMMVRLEFVTAMNCDRVVISCTISQNLPTLASSSGAFTSSSKQKGLGLTGTTR